MFDLFGFLATPLGFVMQFLYNLVTNYGWAIIIFTILLRLVLFPLGMKQQKSTARMQAFQPMVKDIQKKWANDRQRQQQEMQKLYEEHNVKMSAGCLPMLVNMLVLFGIIAVIQAPLTHVMQVTAEEANLGYAIIQQYDEQDGIANTAAGYTNQSLLIDAIKNEDTRHYFADGMDVPVFNEQPLLLTAGQTIKDDNKVYNEDGTAVRVNVPNEAGEMVEQDLAITWEHRKLGEETINRVIGFNFEFLGLNLADAPQFSGEYWYTLVMPVLSLLTMLLSQVIIMKTSGQSQNRMQMLIMTLLFGALFAFYAFTVPAGFSLYYTMSNVVMTVQQIILRRIYDPVKITAEVEAEIEAKRTAKKAKKKVVVKDEAGNVVDRELSAAELAKIRLAKARELDAKRYADDSDADDAEDEKRAEKARAMDEAKYGDDEQPNTAVPDDRNEEDDEPGAGADEEEVAADAYKPGRRKRARQKKDEPESFVDQEQQSEKKETEVNDKEGE